MISNLRKAAFASAIGFACIVLGASCGGDGTAKQRFMLGTAGSGGEVYIWGGGAAKVVNQHAPGVQLTAQLTAGSGENLVRMANGGLKIGLSSNELIWEMATAREDLGKYEPRAVFAMYLGEWHWVARRSFPGNTIYDFKGKRVSFGPKGGGSYQLAKYVLDALNLRFADFDARYLSVAETIDALKDRAIDGYIVGMGIPAPTFLDLATMPGGIKLIGLAKEDIEKARQQYSFLTETVIPANTYKNVDYEVRGLGRWHFMIASPEFPEQAAYEIAQALTEHHQELVDVVPAAKQSTAENTIQHAMVPLHPGVARYFRESRFIE
jgi:TRAP transporter TAXI family solute receptor